MKERVDAVLVMMMAVTGESASKLGGRMRIGRLRSAACQTCSIVAAPQLSYSVVRGVLGEGGEEGCAGHPSLEGCSAGESKTDCTNGLRPVMFRRLGERLVIFIESGLDGLRRAWFGWLMRWRPSIVLQSTTWKQREEWAGAGASSLCGRGRGRGT